MKKEFTVYEKGTRKICICYGDIMKLGFPKKKVDNKWKNDIIETKNE